VGGSPGRPEGARLRAGAIAALLLALALPSAAAAEWKQVRTAHFTFIGDVSDRDLREMARMLELFREAVGRLMPRATTRLPAPTTVILFGSDRAFEPYQVRQQGTRVEAIAGYFQQGDTVNYIALNVSNRRDALRIAFHEYVHAVVASTIGPVPDWLGEGLAQLLETLQVNREGVALVGAPRVAQLLLLLEGPLLPLGELVTASTLEFESNRRRAMFYAQSWALAHYLHQGSATRSTQLRDYIDRLQRGQAPEAAFAASFQPGAGELEVELRTYIAQLRFRMQQVVTGTPLTPVPVAAPTRMADAEAAAWLGDLLARTGRIEDARRTLEPLAAADSGNARAALALGWLELRESRLDRALPLIERAARLRPDDAVVQGAWGAALYDQARRADVNRSAAVATLARAREVLERAVALDPTAIPAVVDLAHVEMALGERVDRAERLMAQAVAAAPGRLDYHVGWADALHRLGRVDRATELLSALASREVETEVRSAARARLTELADPKFASGGAAARPALRVVQAGEVRVEGRLRRLECTDSFSVFHVETGTGTLKLVEPIGGAQLLSYGGGGARTVACGVLADAPPVLATYRPPTGTQLGDGVAVAIEFVRLPVPADLGAGGR
jgi:tetratricopeptide (TPR) repeat protein